MESRPRKTACCCKCKDPPQGEFKKVIDLGNVGLDIYVHKNIKDEKGYGTNKHSFILHNTANKELKRPDFISEMCQYRTSCMKCKRLVSKVHSLMNKIEYIQKNQILGICEYCSCRNKSGNCRRCEYIINKFVSYKDNVFQTRKTRHLTWINKMYSVLQDFLDRESSGKYEIYRDDPDLMIDEIVKELKRIENLEHPQTRTTKFPAIQKIRSSSRDLSNKENEPEKHKEVIKTKPKFNDANDISRVPKTEGCVCKYITDKIIRRNESIELLSEEKLPAGLIAPRGSKVTVEEANMDREEVDGTKYKGKRGKFKKELSEGEVVRRGKNIRKYLEEYYRKENKSLQRGWSDEYFFRRQRWKRDGSEENISCNCKRNDLDEYFKGRPQRDYSDEDNSGAEQSRAGVWPGGKISRELKKYTNESPQEKYFKGDASEEYISKRVLAVDHNLTLKTLKERSDQYLAKAKKERGSRKIQEEIRKRSDKNEKDSSRLEIKSQKDKYAKDLSISDIKSKDKNVKDSLRADIKSKDKNVKDPSRSEIRNKDKNVKDLSRKIKSSNNKSKGILDDKLDHKNDKKNKTVSSSGSATESQIKLSKLENKENLKVSESEKDLFTFLSERRESKQKRHSEEKTLVIKKEKPTKPTKLAPIRSLPKSKRLRSKQIIIEKVPEKFVECDQPLLNESQEMIRGTNIIPYDPRNKDEQKEEPPLLFKIAMTFPDISDDQPLVKTSQSVKSLTDVKSSKSKFRFSEYKSIDTKGVLRYSLSDQTCIEKGLTVLPTTTTMRRMHIYKMKLTHLDWFKRNAKKEMFYDTGERLALIHANGNGRWFYKNHKVALDCYTAKEPHVGRRYIIYSSGLEKDNGKPLPVTVLACFDHLGNGVVYDHFGNVRIKYNQTEGAVVDSKIGPPSKWKWHSLNEPPVLQQVYHETYSEKDPQLDEVINEAEGKNNIYKTENTEVSLDELEMLTIEMDNFVKERAFKQLQEFRLFKIRMKALKINDQFSLRVLDQSDISLTFQDAPVYFKLNLGMQLISTEIIDVETAEVSEVATPYDRFPPRSQSVADIQELLQSARDFDHNNLRRTKGSKLRKFLTGGGE